MDDLDDAGLLDGLEDTAREERAELLRWLRAEHRAGDAELRHATENGTVVLVAAGRVLGTAERFSARDLAASPACRSSSGSR